MIITTFDVSSIMRENWKRKKKQNKSNAIYSDKSTGHAVKKKPRGTCVEHTKVVKVLFASLLIWKSSEISHYICFNTALHVTAGFY